MKKLKLFLAGLFAACVAVTGVSANANVVDCSDTKNAVAKVEKVCYKDLASAIQVADGKTIALVNQATLTSKVTIGKGESLRINLNGFGIMTMGNDYAFDNAGTLTLISNKTTGLNNEPPVLLCFNSGASCVRNSGKATIKNVGISSGFVALKNEANATMNVTGSNVNATMKATYDEGKSQVVSGLGIQNYGTLTVDNSTITGLNGSSAVSNNAKATAKITNSTLAATAVKVSGSKGFAVVGSTILNTDENAVEVTDSTLKGTIQGKVATSGEITTIMENLQYMTKGTRVVLAENTVITPGTLAANRIVPEGITLVVPKNVKLTVEGVLTVEGTLEGKVDAAVENETEGTYYGSLELAIVNAKDGDKISILKNINETEYTTDAAKKANAIVNGKKITLNLNGHEVNTNLLNTADGDLTILDEAGRAEFNGDIDNEGTLTIKSGYFTNVPTTEEGAKTNLIGGTYPANQLNNYVAPEGQQVVKNADGTVTLKYQDADYSELDEALAKAAEIDLTKYTDETVAALAEAIEAAENVDRALTVVDQEKVDALTKALTDAIAGLKEVENSGSAAENPNTLDSLPLYLVGGAVAVLGVAGLGYSIKKKFEN